MRAPAAALALLLLALTLAPALPAPAAAAGPQPLLAGAAKVDITPPVTTPMWGYTGRHCALYTAGEALGLIDPTGHPLPRCLAQRLAGVDTEAYAKTFLASEGVHTRLYANAFVLDDGEAYALVLADLGGIPGELHQAVVDRLAERGVPIPRERLLLGATHTHGGPGGFFQYQGYALLGGDQYDPRVAGFLADQVARAVAEAWQRREPATLAIGTALVAGATHNRSGGAHATEHGHDHDHVKEQARVLRVDTAAGRPLGLVSTFAAHGTIVDVDDLLFTGDNQGMAARMVARGIAAASGQGEHDVVVTYLNGAEGDVSAGGSGRGFFERVEDAGRRQAGPILAAWRSLEGKGLRTVDLDSRYAFTCFCGQEVLPGEAISPLAILGTGAKLPAGFGVPGHGAKTPLLAGAGLVPQVVRLQALRIHDLVWVTMPGEASVALGEQIERDIEALGTPARPVRADVVGLANDYVSYMSTLGEYDWQDYEGTFNLYGRMTGPLFRQELVRLAGALLRGEPVAPGYLGVLEHPDTTLPTVPPLALVPGQPPGAVEQPAAQVAPGQVARFAWRGGSPAVDHPPDVPMVRVLDAAGAPVADDLGFEVRVRYQKLGADEHRWAAEWPVRPGTAPGAYAIHVEGRHVALPGDVQPYALASQAFEVLP